MSRFPCGTAGTTGQPQEASLKRTRLSPSALNLFKDCPLCFWLEKNEGIKRPRGIFPSLPGGMDMAIKEYFDGYRAKGVLPPEISGKVRGKLFSDRKLLEKWRSWRATPLRYEDRSLNAILSGALDDCLVEGDLYIPVDYKTRGFTLKDDSSSYYQIQLDCYALMLEGSGLRTPGFAYLIYYWPAEVKENGMVRFNVEPVQINTSCDAAKNTIREAVLLLASRPPKPSPECEYCALVTSRWDSMKGKIII